MIRWYIGIGSALAICCCGFVIPGVHASHADAGTSVQTAAQTQPEPAATTMGELFERVWGPAPEYSGRITDVDVQGLSALFVPPELAFVGERQGADWIMGTRYTYRESSGQPGRSVTVEVVVCESPTEATAALLEVESHASLPPPAVGGQAAGDRGFLDDTRVWLQVNNVAVAVYWDGGGSTAERMRTIGDKIAQELRSGASYATRTAAAPVQAADGEKSPLPTAMASAYSPALPAPLFLCRLVCIWAVNAFTM